MVITIGTAIVSGTCLALVFTVVGVIIRPWLLAEDDKVKAAIRAFISKAEGVAENDKNTLRREADRLL
jgi:hypothetical protein